MKLIDQGPDNIDKSPTMYPRRRKRRVLIVNPKVQIGYGLAVVWLITASVLITALTVYYTVSAVSYESVNSKQYVEAVNHVHTALIFIVGGTIVLMGALGFLLTVYFLHRIVGPVYRVEQILKAASRGEFITNVHLRKNDEFNSLADSLVHMLRSVRPHGLNIDGLGNPDGDASTEIITTESTEVGPEDAPEEKGDAAGERPEEANGSAEKEN